MQRGRRWALELAPFEAKARPVLAGDLKKLEYDSTSVYFKRQGCDLGRSDHEGGHDQEHSGRAQPAGTRASDICGVAMATKSVRDPLHNSISIERESDGRLLELLDTPAVRRLRRLYQLGVSDLAHPGADHNRRPTVSASCA
jgi:hypothetical protein